MYRAEAELSIAVKESLKNEETLTDGDEVQHLDYSSMALFSYLKSSKMSFQTLETATQLLIKVLSRDETTTDQI